MTFDHGLERTMPVCTQMCSESSGVTRAVRAGDFLNRRATVGRATRGMAIAVFQALPKTGNALKCFHPGSKIDDI